MIPCVHCCFPNSGEITSSLKTSGTKDIDPDFKSVAKRCTSRWENFPETLA
ncbi:Uncharacterised protein [Chlamydia abortus]|nr:Uncharacterised protein [Chlamydia abortus]